MLTLLVVLSALVATPRVAWAVDADSGKWVVNSDGTLSIDQAAAENAVKSVESNVSLVLIGSNGGTITLPASVTGATSGIVYKLSSANDAALVLYNPKVDKSTVSAMLKEVKYSSGTTSINIAVTDGDTSINISSSDTTFGIVNADGTAHMYKYVTGTLTWIGAFHNSVAGGYTLGGFKGYLATVTTQKEADMLFGFYNSVSSGNTNGGWIGATSMRYVKNTGISDYGSVDTSAKVTPSNYENVTSITKETITNGFRIKGSQGAYYWTNTTANYASYFYWASGPEQGQAVPTSLWNSGEPNNSGGECSTVASYSNTSSFNDFPPSQTVPGYFLEFSIYDAGLASSSVTYKSTTIYKVNYDANGATSGAVPDVQAKFLDQDLTLATNSGNLAKDGNVGFNGWNTQADGQGTHYDAGGTYPANSNANVTLYAEWVTNPAKEPAVTGPSDLTLDYGYGEDSSRSLSVTATPDPGAEYNLSYQWYSNTSKSNQDGMLISGATAATYEVPTGQDVGEYYYYCIVTAVRQDNGNKAAVASACATVTVQPAAASITFAENSVTKTYGDEAFANTLANTGDGTVSYESSDKNVATVDPSTGQVTIVGAGSATITATVAANTTHYTYATKTETFSLTVNKAPITPVVTMSGYTYAGTLPAPTTSGNTGGGTVTYYYSETNAASGGTAWSGVTSSTLNVGTYYMYAEVAATDNYAAATSEPVAFTVSPATMTVSDSGYSGVYDGAGHSISVSVTTPTDATVSYRTAASGEYDLTTNPSFVNVGSNTVYYQVTRPNYTTVEGSKTVEITPATLTNVSVAQKDPLSYTGSEQVAEVTTQATAVADQPVTFSYSASADGSYAASVPAFTDAGTHTVYYHADAPNHTQASGSFVVTIGQAQTNTVGVSLEGWSYGESPKQPSATATFGANTATFSYSNAADGTFTESVPTGAGTWYVKATVAETSNYVGGQATAPFVIDKAKAVPSTLTPNSLTYEGAAQQLAAADDSTLVGGQMRYALGESADAAPTEGWADAIPSGTDAGSYYVWYQAVGDANHSNSEPACVTVEIARRPVALASASAIKVYDGHPLTSNEVKPSEGGFVDGQGASYEVTGSQTVVGSSANTFTYTLNEGTLESNYDVSKVEGLLTVTSRDARFEISPVARSASFAYDGAAHEVSGLEKESFEVEGIVYTVSGLTAEASATDVGSYAVNVTGTAVVSDPDGNDVSSEFAVTPVAGTLVITQASENPVSVSLDGWTYGDEAAKPSCSARFGAETAAYSYAASAEDPFSAQVPSDAGTWYVRATVAEAANYVGGTAVAEFVIAKAAISPEVSIASWTSDSTPSEPKLAEGSNPGGGTVTFEYRSAGSGEDGWSTVPPTKAGSYQLRASVGETANYLAGSAVADFSVTPARVIETEVVIEGDAPVITPTNLEELVGPLLDEEERAAVEAGKTARLVLVIKGLKADQVPAEDASAIGAVAQDKGLTIGSWLDISLLLRIEGRADRRITKTDSPVRFSVAIPESLRAADSRTFYLLRCHGGAAEVVGSGMGESVEAESDLFSTYALGYADASAAPTVRPAARTAILPRTGDVAAPFASLVALLAGGGALSAGVRARRRRR